MPKVFELKRARAEKAQQARKVVELALSEKRSLTEAEDSVIKAIEADISGERGLDRQIAVMERVEAVESGGEAEGRGIHQSGRIGGDGASLPPLDGKHRYSLLRAYRCLIGVDKGGLESEVSQEIATRTHKPAQGIYIPWHLATHRDEAPRNLEARSLTTAAGAGSVANILGTELIELLRNRMVCNAMGATILNDMTGGTFSLPKQTSATQMYWVAEGTSPNASNLNIGQVTWTPKTAGAFTDVTRKFMLQTNQDAEALARRDLAKQIAIGLDYAGLNGTGSGQMPLGILQDPNIPTFPLGGNGGAPTWQMAVDLEKLVAQSNAEFGRLGYVTSNAGRATLKQTLKVAGSNFPIFIWENDTPGDLTVGARGVVNGYRAMATQQVPSNLAKGSGTNLTAIIYGNWESLTFAFWSGLDLMIDPYTGSSSGTVRFVALQDLDIQFRYEQSFASSNDMVAS